MSGVNNQPQYSVQAEGTQQHYRVEFDTKAGHHKLYIGNKACVVKQSGNVVTTEKELREIADLFTNTLAEEKIAKGEKWHLGSEGVQKMKGGALAGTVKLVNKELYQAGVQNFVKTAVNTNKAAEEVLQNAAPPKEAPPPKPPIMDLAEPAEEKEPKESSREMPPAASEKKAWVKARESDETKAKRSDSLQAGSRRSSISSETVAELVPVSSSQEAAKKTPLEKKSQEFVSIAKSLLDITSKVGSALKKDPEAFLDEIEILDRVQEGAKGFAEAVEKLLNPIDTDGLAKLVESGAFKELAANVEKYVTMQGGLEQKLASKDPSSQQTVGKRLRSQSNIDVPTLSIKPVQIFAQLQLHMTEISKEFPEGSRERSNMEFVQQTLSSTAAKINDEMKLLSMKQSVKDIGRLNGLVLKCIEDPKVRITINDAGDLITKERKLLIPGQNRVIKSDSASKLIQIAQNAKNNGINVDALVQALHAMKDFRAILKKHPQLQARFEELASKEVEPKQVADEGATLEVDSLSEIYHTGSSEEEDELEGFDEVAGDEVEEEEIDVDALSAALKSSSAAVEKLEIPEELSRIRDLITEDQG